MYPYSNSTFLAPKKMIDEGMPVASIKLAPLSWKKNHAINVLVLNRAKPLIKKGQLALQLRYKRRHGA